MYTQLKYTLTDLMTEIQIDQPFKYIFIKIVGTGIDFGKT